MNNNIIENIEARRGTEGWATAEDLSCMTKSFEFTSFEQANAFIQSVGTVANAKDHHPEWTVKQGGCTVDVRLTTHWAGNTVTRSDFELAEVMNHCEYKTIQSFRAHPTFSNYQWGSF